MLECDGFSVNAKIPEWRAVFVQVNTDYLGRILNNLMSNLEKYGDKKQEVLIEIAYEEDRVGLFFENAIAVPEQYVEGTGIGVRNISLMMEQMGGKAEVVITEKIYRIGLYFPLRGNAKDREGEVVLGAE